MPSLDAATRVCYDGAEPAVLAAAEDLRRDLRDVLSEGSGAEGADIFLEHDATLPDDEAYRTQFSDGRVTIRGGGTLGLVYGLYRLSHDVLGVDPMAFWKDLPPEPRPRIDVPAGEIVSERPVFRYRGWFVNDEDLLTGWQEPQGRRDIDYPYYSEVVNTKVIDRVCESALRCGMNLIIPASFLDVMNEPEADLLRTCVRRGLYVSQHHVEPLGVSHFGFEGYWRRRGEAATFSYRQDPQRILKTWREYAGRWAELAGERVVWQLGLRGRGDRPVWHHDPSITADEAGAFISGAMAAQWRIVREVDGRDQPPSTTTLWMEGAQLIASGKLTFPEGMTIVFSDRHDGLLGPEFQQTPREAGRRYGVYWHPAVWHGPHLVQAIDPGKVEHVFGQVVAAGDTDYAIVNVTNVREHVLGIEAACEAMHTGAAFRADAFLQQWAPPGSHEAYRQFMDAWASPGPWQVFNDGSLSLVARRLLAGIVIGKNHQVISESLRRSPGLAWVEKYEATAPPAIDRLQAVVESFDADRVPTRWRPFVEANLLGQARTLRDLYRLVLVMMEATRDTRRLHEAADLLAGMIEDRQGCEQGRWRNWYRGEVKVGLADLHRKTRALAQALHEEC